IVISFVWWSRRPRATPARVTPHSAAGRLRKGAGKRQIFFRRGGGGGGGFFFFCFFPPPLSAAPPGGGGGPFSPQGGGRRPSAAPPPEPGRAPRHMTPAGVPQGATGCCATPAG